MNRLDWLSCWDELRDKLSERTTWGRTQIIDEMDKIERKKIRELEHENEEAHADQSIRRVGYECAFCGKPNAQGYLIVNPVCPTHGGPQIRERVIRNV